MTKTFQRVINGNVYEFTRTVSSNGTYGYVHKLIQHRQHNYSMAIQLPEQEDIARLMFEEMVDSLDEE